MTETHTAEFTSAVVTGESTATLIETELTRTIAQEVHAGIVADYGKYLPQQTLERNNDLWKHVELVDDIERKRRELKGVNMEGRQTSEREVGYADRKNGRTYIVSPSIAWHRYSGGIKETVADASLQRHVKDVYDRYMRDANGDEQKARESFTIDFLRSTITHEFFHQYEGNGISPQVGEIPTIYYTRKFLQDHGMSMMGGVSDFMEAESYRFVVDSQGESAHQWYFEGRKGFLDRRARKMEKAVMGIVRQSDYLGRNPQSTQDFFNP